MIPNSHFKELLSLLNRSEAKYLVIGGYAVMLYTEPRYTKDLDIWVEAGAENAERVFKALAEFGAPLAGIQAGDFAKADLIYQLAVAGHGACYRTTSQRAPRPRPTSLA